MFNKILLLAFCIALTRGAAVSRLPSVSVPVTPQLDGRIVGGQEVSITKHPHQVSLRHRSCESCAYSHTCGGSIIDENTIVTAAHCVNNRLANNFIVVAGSNYRSGADGVVVRVENIVQHELYNASITDYDVALMFLSSKLPINNVTIGTVKLAAKHPDNGVNSIVTGWGTTTEGGFSSIKLLEVEVPIVGNDRCDEAYGPGRITDRMLCAGAAKGGKDACQGDSGGPLLVNRELAGIVSWGRGCARPEYPGVYASVAFLKTWIETTHGENVK